MCIILKHWFIYNFQEQIMALFSASNQEEPCHRPPTVAYNKSKQNYAVQAMRTKSKLVSQNQLKTEIASIKFFFLILIFWKPQLACTLCFEPLIVPNSVFISWSIIFRYQNFMFTHSFFTWIFFVFTPEHSTNPFCKLTRIGWGFKKVSHFPFSFCKLSRIGW